MTPPALCDTVEATAITGKPMQDTPPLYAMPATQGQIRFWSLDQLQPGNPALNMPLMWRCTGVIDVERLRRAFSACVERHEMLRTTFELVDGQLTQVIGPAYKVAMPVVDLSHLPDAANHPEAKRLIREHAAFRFDLVKGPLLELKLLKYTENDNLLLVSMHHIICDGISLGILLRDAGSFYEADALGVTPQLPELPIQFGDYAVWAEQWRESPEAEASREFWHKSLGKQFDRLNLHRDQTPEAAATAESGDIETLLISPELTAAAHRFCIREGVTFNILLTSIFTALMSRITGQLDLVIGSPCGNRTEDTEELIGLFMNIQVMRIQLEQTSTFRDLLAKVQAWSFGAYENQSLPFEDLIHDPFFGTSNSAFEIPVFFLYQKSFMLTQKVAGLEITPVRSESPGAIFDVMFAIVDRPEEGPRLQLEYSPQFFKLETVQRMLRMYIGLLESAIAAPETQVDELRLLSASEREQILHTWNQTSTDFGPFQSVQHIFAERAHLHPMAIAVECAGRTWTNAELYTHAERIAHKLLNDGLKPGALVGVCVERSFEMIAAILGVLLSGGAYVPLDPRYPAERMQAIAEDSGIGFFITTHTRPLQLSPSTAIIDLSTLPQHEVLTPSVTLPAPTNPHSLAYVIYTSGSTGRPKGVAIEHGSLTNLLRSMERDLEVTSADRLVAIATVAFDMATPELFLPLLTGARLVLASDDQVLDGRHLLALIESSHATIAQATPGGWRMLIDAGWSGTQPMKVICGAEALPRDLADKLLARSSQVWNLYGPTETTVWSTATRVQPGTGPLLLGPPIANTQVYILDQHLEPAPVGTVGELFIAGAGVARCYWNQPKLTSEKFLPNPFAPGRMYRTGDLARWTAEGLFEFLGRSDFQIKIRGYRVEPGDIEAVLNQHSLVRESVVIAHTSPTPQGVPGIPRLIAFVATPEATAEPALGKLLTELGELLKSRLPDYLCPSAIVPVAALPRNPNGKIDRKALPALFSSSGLEGSETLLPGGEYTPPRDPIERQLVQIWQTTLGIDHISIRASFFSLGVGSLAALRLIKQMNRTYSLDLGLASLISASTIESIAELVRTRFAPNTASSLVPIHPQGTRPPIFIVHGVGGNIVNFYGLSQRMGRDQPVYGIQAQALELGKSALLRLEDMAAHYIREIRRVQPEGPYYLLGYSLGGTIALEMAHQLKAAGQQIAMLGMLDSKSRIYMDAIADATPIQDAVQNRLASIRGNTGSLPLPERIVYIRGKLITRTIRYAVKLAASLRLRSVPSFMKSAEDINIIAADNYKLRPFDGRLTLFRATEQQFPDAPLDLGWSTIFQQGFEIREIPGDHERIFVEPGIETLAAQLRDALHQAQAAHTPAPEAIA